MHKNYVADVRVRKQDRNGNTYHDVDIINLHTGATDATAHKRYGYGRMYMQTTADLLNEAQGTTEYTYNNIDDEVLFVVHRY